MILYHQETDSKAINTSSGSVVYSVPTTPPGETIGGNLVICHSPLAKGSSLIQQAWRTIQRVGNQEIKKQAERILTMIQETAATMQEAGYDLSHLPPLRAFPDDDGSVLIEWIFNNFRVGFNIEPDPEESGWYLVSDMNLEGYNISGNVSDANLRRVIPSLVQFAFLNS